MRVLITGCAGFIGSRLTQKLLNKDIKILGIDNLSVGLPKPKNHKNLTFINKDIRNKSITPIIKEFKPDMVFHLAAMKHVQLLCQYQTLQIYR